jgi:alkylhydroperoxidase family enzyme
MARIPDLDSHLTPELRVEAGEMMKLRGLTDPGFYGDLMVHPALFERVKALGTFLRFQAILNSRVREAAILCAAVEQRNAFIWNTHQKVAREAGLEEAELAAIGTHGALASDLEPVRQLVAAVIAGQSVPQDLFDNLTATLTLPGAVELITLTAFYAMMARLGDAFDSVMPGAAATPPWAR